MGSGAAGQESTLDSGATRGSSMCVDEPKSGGAQVDKPLALTKRIALVSAVYAPMINGVAVFTENLAHGLVHAGYEVLVLAPAPKKLREGKKSYFKEISELGGKVVYLRSHELRLYPDQIHQARKNRWGLYEHGLRYCLAPGKLVAEELKRFRPEVVHVQTMDALGKAAARWARKNGVPLVSTEHNQPEVLVESVKLPRWAKRILERWLAGYLVRQQQRSDFVTMPTRQAVENLIIKPGRILRPPVAAVSNGVNLAKFRPSEAKPAADAAELDAGKNASGDELNADKNAPGEVEEDFYRRYDLPQNAPIVLYVGRVDPEKQVATVVKAFAKVWDKIRRAHLVVVGDGVALENVKKLAQNLGLGDHAHFTGRVVGEDLAKMYRIGTVFATASEVETQGIVLLEAAASGLPLIAVNAGAVHEACRDGETGILCRPGDAPGIASALVRILSNQPLREKMQKNALKMARENSLENTLKQFENIYNKVVELK